MTAHRSTAQPRPLSRSRARCLPLSVAGLTLAGSAAALLIALSPSAAFAAATTISYSCNPGPCPSNGTFTQGGVDVTVSGSVDVGGGVLQVQDQDTGQWNTVDSSSGSGTLSAPPVATSYTSDGVYAYRVISNSYSYRCGPVGLNTCTQPPVEADTSFTVAVPKPSPSPAPKPTGSATGTPTGSPSAAPSGGGSQPGPGGGGTPSQPPASAGGTPSGHPSAAASPSGTKAATITVKPGQVPSTTFGGSRGILGLTSVFGSLSVPGLPAPAVAPTPEGTYSATLDYGDQSVPERYRVKEASAEAAADSTTGQLTRALAAALVLVLGSAHLRLWLRSPVEDEEY